MNEKKESRSFISEGLIVAGATAALYMVTFVFEYGYCKYFGIPGFLVEPSTGTVLLSALIISVASVFIFSLSQFPSAMIKKIPWVKLRNRIVVVAIMWTFALLVGDLSSWTSKTILIISTIIPFLDYIFPMILFSGPIRDRISMAEDMISEEYLKDKNNKNTIVVKFSFYIVLINFALLIAFAAGATHAKIQKGFVVLKAAPDFAVVKRYGERMIAVRYEGTPPRATGEFKILDKEKDVEFINLNKLEISEFKN
ncbi:hypothetical protein ACF8OH_15475 [Delftia sp. WSY_9]